MPTIAADIRRRLVDILSEIATLDNTSVHRMLDGPLADQDLKDNAFSIFTFEIGLPTEETMGDIVAFENLGVQIQVRHNKLKMAEEWAYKVWNNLPTQGEEIIISNGDEDDPGTIHTGYNRIWRRSAPMLLDLSDMKGRYRFRVEFGVKRRPEGVTA